MPPPGKGRNDCGAPVTVALHGEASRPLPGRSPRSLSAASAPAAAPCAGWRGSPAPRCSTARPRSPGTWQGDTQLNRPRHPHRTGGDAEGARLPLQGPKGPEGDSDTRQGRHRAGVQCKNVVTLSPGRGRRGTCNSATLGQELQTDTQNASCHQPGRSKSCCNLTTPPATSRGIWRIISGELLSTGVRERGSCRPPPSTALQRHTAEPGSHWPLLQPLLGVGVGGFLLTTPARCG